MASPQHVDWHRPGVETRGARRVTVFPVTCSTCRYRRMLRGVDARKAERTGGCFQCSQIAKARLGFDAMVKLHGWRWAMRHAQAYYEANPSKPEQQMMRLLDQLSVYYRREVPLATKASGRRKWVCLLDFVVYHDGREMAIEVDGVYVHSLPSHAKSDKRKERLLRRRGIPLLRVTDADLKHGAARPKVIDFLNLDLTHEFGTAHEWGEADPNERQTQTGERGKEVDHRSESDVTTRNSELEVTF